MEFMIFRCIQAKSTKDLKENQQAFAGGFLQWLYVLLTLMP